MAHSNNEDYAQEQEMEVEALQAILMDDIEELESNIFHTDARCFQITISPKGDDEDEPTEIPVRLALVFAHTPNYPDKPPLLDVLSLKGVKTSDLQELKKKLQEEALENLGMAMMYTLATSAKEWLRDRFCQEDGDSDLSGDEDVERDEVIEPHGDAVTVETFLAWRERFEAEIALERAKLMPESALIASKEKSLSGRAFFESGRAAAMKGGRPVIESSDEENEEDVDFDEDFDDGDLDEEDILEHYLAQKTENSLRT
ncbi:hypothetical protein O6H91_03G120800 [Diphasiastrum complanatum]|uniref:Uncharacterized protein n=1 Tax=Diphasiastrum complanatum TaxID=34168 RepID=A0ACC2EAQ2_DIPCM|nr:hypothetical protein O6H91_03G120800 [Diphasiastrum complanatum]